MRWRQVRPTLLRGRGFESQAGLQFGGLSHDESCDRAQLSLWRAEPQISDHLPSMFSEDRGPHASVSVERSSSLFIPHSRTGNTYFKSAVLWNMKIKMQWNNWQAASVYLCRIIFFFCLCSLTNRDQHPLCCYPPSPSSRDLTHLPLIIFQPSAPLSLLVNTEALNTAQTVREKLQHAFYALHSPTVLPAWAQSSLRLRGEMKKCIWGDFRE